MVVTILSKTDRTPTLAGKCVKQSSKWPFTGLPREFQAASAGPPVSFPCPKGAAAKSRFGPK